LAQSFKIRIVALLGSRVLFGAERANIDALRALQAKEVKVKCLVRHENWDEIRAVRDFLDRAGLDHEPSVYVDYPAAGYYLKALISFPWRMIRANINLYRSCKNMHATHVHTYNLFFTICVLPALLILKIAVVYRCGDAPTIHNTFFRMGWLLVKRQVSHFVADTKYIKNLLSSSGVDEKRITVLYAPPPARDLVIDETMPSPAPAAGTAFLYVGQLTSHKGVPELLDAFRLVLNFAPDSRLWLAGPTHFGEGKVIKDRAAREFDAEEVIFLGPVENIPGLFARAQVHVAPSMFAEPYGLVVVEAKAASKPSIIFKRGGMSELIKHRKNGLALDEHTARALSEAMLFYVNNPALAMRHGEAAFRSLADLQIENFAQRWFEIYENT
jgi:glycosyltransferase involved in cell wall biosynthesis